MQAKPFSFLCVWALLLGNGLVSGSFPTAQGVNWVSLNFKTLLTWNPKPTNYSYTVEFFKQGENRRRSPHCIQSSETECDLTSELIDLKGRYKADVLSEPARGASFDEIEFPHTTSPPFIPYQDTNIGKPEFKIKVSEDLRKITLYVTDIPTAIFEKNRRQTIRDIFKDDLMYKVIYRKASSSGKKEKNSQSSEIELTDLDKGESYCFIVQAYIPSRTNISKQLGEPSQVQCSPDREKSIFEEYSLIMIAAVILSIIVIISAVIAVIVVCCKRRQKAQNRGKERVPLRHV